jgi:hypothetical protein
LSNFLQDIGAVFVPFSAEIVAYAYSIGLAAKWNWYYPDSIYQQLEILRVRERGRLSRFISSRRKVAILSR